MFLESYSESGSIEYSAPNLVICTYIFPVLDAGLALRQQIAPSFVIHSSNSYMIIDTSESNRFPFQVLCCSNTSSISDYSVTLSNGTNRLNRSDHPHFQQIAYEGCAWNRFRTRSALKNGVYTCNLTDSEGSSYSFNYGLYDKDYNGKHRFLYSSCS